VIEFLLAWLAAAVLMAAFWARVFRVTREREP
jgi:hypothetical protein